MNMLFENGIFKLSKTHKRIVLIGVIHHCRFFIGFTSTEARIKQNLSQDFKHLHSTSLLLSTA